MPTVSSIIAGIGVAVSAGGAAAANVRAVAQRQDARSAAARQLVTEQNAAQAAKSAARQKETADIELGEDEEEVIRRRSQGSSSLRVGRTPTGTGGLSAVGTGLSIGGT